MDEPQPPRFDPRRRTAVLMALLLVTSVAAFEGTAAGRLLAGHRDSASVAPPALRAALEQSLLPVFALLLVLSSVHLAVTGWFPGRADAAAQPASAPEAMEQPAEV